MDIMDALTAPEPSSKPKVEIFHEQGINDRIPVGLQKGRMVPATCVDYDVGGVPFLWSIVRNTEDMTEYNKLMYPKVPDYMMDSISEKDIQKKVLSELERKKIEKKNAQKEKIV